VKVNRLNDAIAKLADGTDEEEVVVPDDLRHRVEPELAVNRARMWDLVVADLAEADTA
jgi:hypothetical protein